ncbi:inositol monophosphatase family protein [Phycicoccus ginsengisoli]
MGVEGLGAHELEELEQVAMAVAVEAGRLIVHERPGDLRVAKTKSTATDIVTVMDQRAQDLLRSRLAELRPQDGFLGEEEGGAAARSAVTWVVDPIDGTVNYLYSLPAYAVSVAAVVGDPTTAGAWEPVAGAVVNPVTGELFHARSGGGSWLRAAGAEPLRLQLGEPPVLGQALTGTGFGYDPARRRAQAELLVEVLPQVRDIRRIGSAALDICAVAHGTLDCYFEWGLNAWDMAAAWIVLTEAGGAFTGLDGRPPTPDMVVAGAPALHRELERAVRAAWAALHH